MRCSLRVKFITILFFPFLFVHAQNRDATACFHSLQTEFETVRYRAAIDVIQKHLSGILLFKHMDDHSIRVVFLNEMGSTFFDMSFYPDHFNVNSIMESLDKKAVVKTLSKDLGMILMRSIYRSSTPTFTGVNQLELRLKKKGKVQYYTDSSCTTIHRIENYGRRKKVVSIMPSGYSRKQMPDSIFVQHHNVNFTISLKQMHVTE